MKATFLVISIILFSIVSRSEEKTQSIDKDAVRRVVRSNLAIFKKCYEDSYKNDNTLEGKIVITWNIDSEGTVLKSWIKSTKMNNKNVEDCLLEKVKTLTFPKAPQGTVAEVQYPFIFQGKK